MLNFKQYIPRLKRGCLSSLENIWKKFYISGYLSSKYPKGLHWINRFHWSEGICSVL